MLALCVGLLAQGRAAQLTTLRAWGAAYRAERQTVRDGVQAAATAQQTALDVELADIDANIP